MPPRSPVAAVLLGTVLACGGGQPAPPATRQVSGTRQVTVWSDTGKGATYPTVDSQDPATVVAAWSPEGKSRVSGTIDRTGAFKIDGVPSGPYLLEFKPPTGGRWFVQTDAATVDLSGDLLGRIDLRTPTQATSVTFELSGLASSDPQDLIELTSSNVSLWERLVPQQTLPSGVTVWSAPFAWAARPSPLVSIQSGDVAYVHQLSTRADPGSGLTYQAASTWASPPLSIVEGANQRVAVSLAPVSANGRLTATWRLSGFEACAADLPAGTQAGQHVAYIEGIAWGLDRGPTPRTGNPDLLHVTAQPGTQDPSLDLSYGRFLPPLWKERLTAGTSLRQRLPFQGGTLGVSVAVVIQAAMDAPPVELAPTMGPPRGVRVGDRDATQELTGVGSGPVISWTAPRLGAPDFYVVDLGAVTISGGQTSFSHVASLFTTETRARFPEGTLPASTPVVAFVSAIRAPTGRFRTAPAPFRVYFPKDFAQVATAPFTP